MSEAQAVYRVGNDAETNPPTFAENHVKAVAEFFMVERCPEESIAQRNQSDRRTVQGNSANP